MGYTEQHVRLFFQHSTPSDSPVTSYDVFNYIRFIS